MAATKFTAVKDPDAVLPYEWDWTDWLGTDTIAAAEFLVTPITGDDTPVVVDVHTNTTTTATAVLSGGTTGTKYTITCRITTAGGYTDDRSLYLTIKEQ